MIKPLTFYTNPMSRGRIVRWMLEEVGAPYETIILDWGKHKSPDYLALNPMGKVPTIVHGQTIVTEAAAICAYLADVFPEAGLAPSTTDEARGTYYRWMFFAAGPVEAAMSNRGLGVEVPEAKKGMIGYGCLEDVIAAMAFALKGRDYILGDQFSAADVYFGSSLGWAMKFGIIPEMPVFKDYAARIFARPAAIRAAQIDDDLIAIQAQKED